ncbi:phosphonopyruvate decarboxylase [Spirochaeta thermophila]|uniref:Phosphonopyruvate decarboxylase n=1 Tax=Winmispira thermophila (strain ATCC 49972 / DSM 6192 / RI 19.B1) TaxID=665571 RepID=E0RN31_WINT6|nr:phosphonopyruvate decarboxylase [Spirochaeta thermophila]ADN02500.1 phosphonopyruvate decarboxylase [Spirochaeta thermophila DSM 6192]
MLDTEVFGKELQRRGFDFYSGVPCSFLKSLINYAINECEYVMAANEGDAVAICAGARLGGRKAVVLMQNSGLGNAVSPLTSLTSIFRIPVLGFVSLRGEPGLGDEPQHELMGTITDEMLSTMKIPWEYLSDAVDEAVSQLDRAEECLSRGESFFFIVKKGTFSPVPLKSERQKAQDSSLPDRVSMLQAVREARSEDTLLLATTGFTSRELYTLGDEERNFYMVGSLGCLSSFALGLNLVRPSHGIIALDGDGSLLMRTGAMAVVAAYRPQKLLHILFNNEAHESTGGQSTVSPTVDWENLARGFGYPEVYAVQTPEELKRVVNEWESQGGLAFVHVRIRQGTLPDLGRPKVKPFEVAKRIAHFIEKRESI